MALVSNKDKEMCSINHSKLWVHEPELAQATGSEVTGILVWEQHPSIFHTCPWSNLMSLLWSFLCGACLFTRGRKRVRSQHTECFLFVMLLYSSVFGDHATKYSGFGQIFKKSRQSDEKLVKKLIFSFFFFFLSIPFSSKGFYSELPFRVVFAILWKSIPQKFL